MPGKAVLRQNGRGQRPWSPVQPSSACPNQVLWERALWSSTRVCGTAHLEQVQHPRGVKRPPSLHVFQHHRHPKRRAPPAAKWFRSPCFSVPGRSSGRCSATFPWTLQPGGWGPLLVDPPWEILPVAAYHLSPAPVVVDAPSCSSPDAPVRGVCPPRVTRLSCRGCGGSYCLFQPGCSSLGRLAALCPWMIQSGLRRLMLLDPTRMIQSVAFGRRLSPDDPVRWEPVHLVPSRMRPSGASGSHLSPDAPVWGAAAPAACSAGDVPVWGVGTPSSAFCCRFLSAAPSCFAPYDPVLGTPCVPLLLAASPRPRPGLLLTASPRAPPLCCSSASAQPRPLGCSTSSPRPRPLVCIAASPGPCPHLGFSAFPRPCPPLRFAASPLPRPRGRFSCCPWPTFPSVAIGRRLSSDVPVRGAVAPAPCSVPYAPVRGVWPPVVLRCSSPGAGGPCCLFCPG